MRFFVPEADPHEELATLVSALRAHLELCAASGATGFVEGAARIAPAGGSSTSLEAAGPVVPSPGLALRPTHAPVAQPALSTQPAAPSRSLDDARARLQILSKAASDCVRCGLHAERKQAVFARGTGSSGLCFVGEGPGADEDEQGFPFVGKAGQLLDKMIEAMGLDRDEVYVCNIVKCRPPKNRKPEPDEMSACRPYLTEQIELIDPRVIVALGATAVEGLIGASGGITRLRGNWRLYKGKIAVMPTFHPAYLLRTPEAKREVWQDLKEVLRHLGRSVPARK